MTDHGPRHNQPIHDAFHPAIYRTIVALTIWLVFSIWFFFDSGAYVVLTLAMITVFFFIVTMIPIMIWLNWRKNAPPDEVAETTGTLREWASQEVATWTGALSGRAAAIQTLLPIAAVSIGMTVFGIVYYFDIPHGAGY